MAAAVYARPEPQTLTALERRPETLEISFFDHSANLIGSIPERLKAVMRNKGDTVLLIKIIEPTHWLEVMLLSHYCAIFGCCNTNEYYNCC